jgi:photosystem II stability/assembly factor-like uncharacterized protein
MHRKLGWALRTPTVVMAVLAAACAPQILPVPATDTPPVIAPSETPPPLNAPAVEAPALVAIRMFDPKNGWGVSETAILRTIDGAITWHDVSPIDGEFGYAVTTEFIDGLHGWVLAANPDDALNGILYRTSDGGVNWREAPVPFGGGTLQFIDEKRGWMMASLGAGAGSMAIAVHVTQDSGATWTQTYVNDPTQSGAGDSLPLGGLKDGITPISTDSAWIGGVVYEPGRIYLYQTTDGGRRWAGSPIEAPEDYREAELETTGPIFVDAQVAILPLHMSSQVGVKLATYISRDGGASWRLNPEFIPHGGSVDFVTADVGFAWNGQNFYLTTNAANSWTAIAPDVDFTDSFAGMDFVTPQVGFVLSDRGDSEPRVYVTYDSGATWGAVGP